MLDIDGRMWSEILKRADCLNLVGKVRELDVVIYQHGGVKQKRVITRLFETDNISNLKILLKRDFVNKREVKFALTTAISKGMHDLATWIWRIGKCGFLTKHHVQHVLKHAITNYRRARDFGDLCDMIGVSSDHSLSLLESEVLGIKDRGAICKILGSLGVNLQFPATCVGYMFYERADDFLEFLEKYVDVTQFHNLVHFYTPQVVNVSSFLYAAKSHKLRPIFAQETVRDACLLERFRSCRVYFIPLLREPQTVFLENARESNYEACCEILMVHPEKKWSGCSMSHEVGGWPDYLIEGWLQRRGKDSVDLKEFYEPEWERPPRYIENVCRLSTFLEAKGYRIEALDDLALMFCVETGDIEGVKARIDRVPLQLNGWSLFLDMSIKRERIDVAELIMKKMEIEREKSCGTVKIGDAIIDNVDF